MKKIIFCLVFLLASFYSFSQSSEIITDILESKQVTLGQVCYLSAVQQGLMEESSSYSDAVEVLYRMRQIPINGNESSLIPLANVTYIFAEMWNIKGGLLYRMFHGAPRYTYKQMKADRVLPDGADPAKILTGQELLSLYTSCSIKYGKMQLSID